MTAKDFANLKSQFATSNTGRGGRRYLPQVYTEHGALMAATILNSPRAIDVTVFVVRGARLRPPARARPHAQGEKKPRKP